MRPEGIPEFLPRDDMSSRLHRTIMIPPYTSRTTKLLGGELSLVCISTRYCQQSKLRIDSTEPSIGVQWVISLAEKRRLGTKEFLLVTRWLCITSSMLLAWRILLPLNQLTKQFGLHGHQLGQIWWWWRWLLRSTASFTAEAFRRSTSMTNHLYLWKTSIRYIILAPKINGMCNDHTLDNKTKSAEFNQNVV